MTACTDCSKRDLEHGRARRDLALFARRAARQRQPSAKILADIEKAKSVVASTKAEIDNHAATHAGQAAS